MKAGEPLTVREASFISLLMGHTKKERRKTDTREGSVDGTPPPHRDFKERGVDHSRFLYVSASLEALSR